MSGKKPFFLEFEVPALPPSVNDVGNKHWAVKNKIIQEWVNKVALATEGLRPEHPIECVTITYTRFSTRPLDFDNLVNSFKATQDALVKLRIITDDSWYNIIEPRYLWQKAKMKDVKIKVTLTELLDGSSSLKAAM